MKGEAIIGANVTLKGTTNGTITDFDGHFTLNVNDPNGILAVSFIGYKTKEVKIGEKTIFQIILEEDTETLDEVVVVGYGSQKKVNVTGSVSMVDSKVIESRPVQNVSQALQGVVPGLNMSVGNSGGALDSSLSINIRGAGTIGEGSSGSPLVLILSLIHI